MTTEGGLNVVSGRAHAKWSIVCDAGLLVSAFIDAEDRRSTRASWRALTCERVHTGPYARLRSRGRRLPESGRRTGAGRQRGRADPRLGDALNGACAQPSPVGPIAALTGIEELHRARDCEPAIYSGMRSRGRDEASDDRGINPGCKSPRWATGEGSTRRTLCDIVSVGCELLSAGVLYRAEL